MGENKKSFTDSSSTLANIVNTIEESDMFEDDINITIGVSESKYKDIVSHFREIDRGKDKFTIEISDVKFNFFLKK